MKTLSQILKQVKALLKGPEPNPQHIFNCRDIAWITDIKSTRFSPDKYIKYFFLYFNSGLEVKICQDTQDENCPELEELRKLFINSIGYSYVSIDYPSTQDKEDGGIYIMSHRKKISI